MNSATFFIARLFADRGLSDSYLSLSRWVAMFSVAVGLAILIVGTAAINGVQRLTETQLLQAFPHVIVHSQVPQDTRWQPLMQRLRSHPAVRSAQLLVHVPAMASANEAFVGVTVAGFGPEEATQPPPHKIKAGAWSELWRSTPSVVVGQALAEKLQLRVGSQLPLLQSRNPASGESLVVRSFEVVAIYESGTDLDQTMVVVSDAALRDFLQWPAGGFNTLNIKLHDPLQARAVSLELQKDLPAEMTQTDWIAYGARLFAHIQNSKRMVMLSLVTILLVASFNVTSMLFVLVNGKLEEIAVLRSLGATRPTVAAVFMVLGGLIALPGVVIGTVTGLVTSAYLGEIFHAVERLLGTRLMAADVYPVHELVGHVQYSEVLLLDVVTIILCVLMSAYPAWRASKVDPAVVFRRA